MTEENVDLLVDIETRLIQASHGKRFANFIVDLIISYIFLMLVYTLIALVDLDLFTWLSTGGGSGAVAGFLINILILGGFMALIELVTKGRSIGKLLTGTKAVMKDGSPLTASAAFARGFTRMVPFEAFSALGSPSYPWHDKWTNTTVVKERR